MPVENDRLMKIKFLNTMAKLGLSEYYDTSTIDKRMISFWNVLLRSK